MKKSFGDYHLILKGNRNSGSLWLGPDHLLTIESYGFLAAFSETYRRFDFKNIQTISYARTNRGMWLAILMGVMVALLGLGAVASFRDATPLSGVFGICAVGVLVALIVHMARGPTCVCKLQTAVQVFKLKPVDRMRKAARFLAQIQPLCLAHQGGAVVDGQSQMTQVPEAAPTVQEVRTLQGIKLPWAGSKLVTWSLALVFGSGIMTVGVPFVHNIVYLTANLVLGATAYILAVFGRTSSIRYRMPRMLAVSLWGVAGTFTLSFFLAYGLLIWGSAQMVSSSARRRPASLDVYQNNEVYRHIAEAGFDELGPAAWAIVGVGGMGAAFSLLGLSCSRRSPAGATASPASSPPPVLPPANPSPSE